MYAEFLVQLSCKAKTFYMHIEWSFSDDFFRSALASSDSSAESIKFVSHNYTLLQSLSSCTVLEVEEGARKVKEEFAGCRGKAAD